jgi:phosphoenolpyruvate carboxykinase (GTP)
VVRRDPMAMLPFCGYDMGQYFQHWLDMQQHIEQPPKIFQVNWFRKDSNGKFLWPGYGENMRVLKWIVSRAHVKMSGQETLLGWIPKAEDFDLSDLDLPADKVNEATAIDEKAWRTELESQGEFFKKLEPTLPKTLELQRQLLLSRLDHA